MKTAKFLNSVTINVKNKPIVRRSRDVAGFIEHLAEFDLTNEHHKIEAKKEYDGLFEDFVTHIKDHNQMEPNSGHDRRKWPIYAKYGFEKGFIQDLIHKLLFDKFFEKSGKPHMIRTLDLPKYIDGEFTEIVDTFEKDIFINDTTREALEYFNNRRGCYLVRDMIDFSGEKWELADLVRNQKEKWGVKLIKDVWTEGANRFLCNGKPVTASQLSSLYDWAVREERISRKNK